MFTLLNHKGRRKGEEEPLHLQHLNNSVSSILITIAGYLSVQGYEIQTHSFLASKKVGPIHHMLKQRLCILTAMSGTCLSLLKSTHQSSDMYKVQTHNKVLNVSHVKKTTKNKPTPNNNISHNTMLLLFLTFETNYIAM